MAKPGDVLENPVTGERAVFRKTTAETNGESVEYELTFRPSGFVAQQHLHPHQSEKHEVLEGELGIVLDGEERVLKPGEAVVVPPAGPHRLFPIGDGTVRVLFELRPALRTEELLELYVQLAREDKVNSKGYPKLLHLAVLSREFEDEGYATRPPLGVQRALFAPLAALGRARGYGRPAA